MPPAARPSRWRRQAPLVAALFVLCGLAAPAQEMPAGDPFARAAALARGGRCAPALALLDQFAAVLPGDPARVLSAAQAAEDCGRPAQALAWLASVQPPPPASGRDTDPRIALTVGRLLLELGDDDAAARWCGTAARQAEPGAALRREAEACAAVADAERGVLPQARIDYVEACRRAFDDPALAGPERIRQGLAAAWTLLGRDDAGEVRRALAMLDRLALLRPDGPARVEADLVRALGLVALGRVPEAAALVSRPTPAVTGAAPVLHKLVLARIAAAGSSRSEADAALAAVAADARRAGLPELAAAAGVDRVRLVPVGPGSAALRAPLATAALADWPAGGPIRSRTPFADPALPRRAVELVIEPAWGKSVPADPVAAELLPIAERLRLALRGRVDEIESVPDVDALQRQLASRRSMLTLFLIGETRSFGFVVQPAQTSAFALPAGDELASELGPVASGLVVRGRIPEDASRAFRPMLEQVIAGSTLLLAPDGFLDALPWSQLPVPAAVRPDAAELRSVAQPAVLPSLAAALDARAARVQAVSEHATFIAITAAPAADTSERPRVARWSSRFQRCEVLHVLGQAASAVLDKLRPGRSIVHLDVPLLAAGNRPHGVVVLLPPGPGGSSGTAVALEDLLPEMNTTDLVTFAPAGGWSALPGCLVRAGCRAVELGARTALVPLAPLDESASGPLWQEFYARLGAGELKVDALQRAEASWAKAAPASARPPLVFAGQPATRVIEPGPIVWPFWAALGGAIAIVGGVLLHALRPRSDPFDIEPPEEREVLRTSF